MTNADNKSGIKFIYKQLLTYVKPFSLILVLGILANIVYSLIDAGFTYLIKIFLDKGFMHIDMQFVHKIPLIVLVGITLRGLFSALANYCMTSVARSVVTVLRQRVFAHVLALPADYYDERTSSELVSKMLYDVEQVAQVGADALTDFVQNVCLVIGLLTVMLIMCWQLSLVFLVTVPFMGFIVSKTNKRVRRISHQLQQNMGRVTELAQDAISGYRIVRIFGGQKIEEAKFAKATNLARQNDMKVAVSKACNVAGVQFVIAIGIAMIILISIQLMNIMTVSAGAFLAIMAAMLQLVKPMKTLTTLNTTIQRGVAGAESVFNVLKEPTEPTFGKEINSLVAGSIEFNQVTYSYRGGKNVLEEVSFKINKGETLALVGHSGSGKSTIASLLTRFYTPTSGKILIDGQDITSWSLASLRKQIALVSQDVILFNDTIFNNIAYGQDIKDLAQVKMAARLAFADEFIEKLPLKYDTMVGERGLLLSGGQRQRVAIARAILKNAPILILDEATSALDSESEHFIQLALESVMQNRTTLVIAHRLSTITKADAIVVLNQGAVIEVGEHETLLAKNGHYAHLIRTQQQTNQTKAREVS
ncbi:MAG: lipid A export permease/ATP-binding protein MsbA [Legionellales bacterium RIFCSPHIGHO2_12_FULL_37_14]|nr:MAG: lipid A export permease/ATP-binding protein MsbA [Legionellales bacterium RIFCSPHIGHO2_12_FULL_37_14]